MTLGSGRAEAISDADIAKLADEIGCHPADLEAIAEVESGGFGWFPDGRMKILFEKHQFYKRLAPNQIANATKSGLARKNWISPGKGGYKDQASADDRYRLLDRAIRVNEEAAYQSISMGRFQIMGFNHGVCGYLSAKQMFVQFADSEVNQLRAFAKFLKAKNLYPALRARHFATIETVYNGGGLGGTYAARMKAASDKLRSRKWKYYRPGSMAAPEPPLPPTPDPASSDLPTPAPAPQPAPAHVEAPPARRTWLAALVDLLLSILAKLSRKGRP